MFFQNCSTLHVLKQLLQTQYANTNANPTILITTAPTATSAPVAQNSCTLPIQSITVNSTSVPSSALVTGIPVQIYDGDKLPISRIATSPKVFRGRGEKKTSHNAIEKRYRLSINDKIMELNDLISGKDSKASAKRTLLLEVPYFDVCRTLTCLKWLFWLFCWLFPFLRL